MAEDPLVTRDHAFTVASGILSDALPAIAGEIERRAAELGLTRINERDHMKPWTMAVVRERARDAAGSPEAVSEASHGLGAVWGHLGSVDIALTAADARPAFVELNLNPSYLVARVPTLSVHARGTSSSSPSAPARALPAAASSWPPRRSPPGTPASAEPSSSGDPP
jgi:hypothetical protein